MIIREQYLGDAWLLNKDGSEISVLNHPSETFEFDSIVDIIKQFGNTEEKMLATTYKNNPNPELKRKLLDIYNNNWCKVREWGTYSDEITFRITSTTFNWYNAIISFLLRHPCPYYKITVESTKKHKIYWNNISYKEAIDPQNEIILENLLK